MLKTCIVDSRLWPGKHANGGGGKFGYGRLHKRFQEFCECLSALYFATFFSSVHELHNIDRAWQT